jgi:hypothetical protein
MNVGRRKRGIMGHVSLSTNFHLREICLNTFNGRLRTLNYLLSTTKGWERILSYLLR